MSTFTSTVFAQLYVNEVLPNPTGNEEKIEEWVELYNTSDQTIDLNGYRLKDAANHELLIDSTKTNGSTQIIPSGWLVIYRNGDALFSLNNSDTETVSLFNQDGSIQLDSFSYQDSEEGKSWGRIPDGGEKVDQTLSATPGGANQPPPTPTPTPSPTPTPTSTPTPTPTNTPTPTVKPTIKPTVIPTKKPDAENTKSNSFTNESANSEEMVGGNILGDESQSDTGSNADQIEEEKPEKKPSPYLLPFFISFLGIIFLGVAAYPYIRIELLKRGIDIYPSFLKKKKKNT